MPAPFGVVASGFSRKLLAEVLAEVETAEQAKWGAGTVLDAASPLGQLNGVFSDGIAEAWEIAEAVYQSYNPFLAVGVQLDRIGALRGVTRLLGESDEDYQQRITNTNIGTIKTRELYNVLANIAGVTWLNVAENATASTSVNGMPPHSLAIAMVGGTDADVAAAVYDHTAGGIELVGTTTISHLDANGLCHAVRFSRPTDVTLKIAITATVSPDSCECASTASGDIITDFVTQLNSACALSNGMTVSVETLNKYLANRTGLRIDCILFSRAGDTLSTKPIAFSLNERPVVTSADVVVNIVDECG